ncbi:(2Fe-2S) ferredoxin domain-containing protein [Rhodopseudomonas palustris]|uniref:(2Fe-2S) ferredoxin domain-containing protein n=1 Tax=Rhodopseudomonas palustris TaxID=1076 RepID=UPI002ACD7205|nr:(2Fe-2S) ferredoxin domain-containing protein [Rhodopseudomonas palustris]WQG97889.1 (2Fe-2S) ferredoxin domain-containing protein [Rhodopseudomonas palustris]
MAGLDPAIHVLLAIHVFLASSWMPGTRPGMTGRRKENSRVSLRSTHPTTRDRPYMAIMPPKSAPTILRPKRPPPVLICGKCLSRIKDGKKLKQALKAELKSHAAARGGKRARLVTTGCLGICPKRAVVTASAATLARGEYVLVEDAEGAGEAVGIVQPA